MDMKLVPCAFGIPVYLEADERISKRVTFVHGALLNVGTSGGDVTLYEGRDAESGRKRMVIKALANVTNPVSFSSPVKFENGVFVDIGSNVNSITLIICFGCKPNWQYYPTLPV